MNMYSTSIIIINNITKHDHDHDQDDNNHHRKILPGPSNSIFSFTSGKYKSKRNPSMSEFMITFSFGYLNTYL